VFTPEEMEQVNIVVHADDLEETSKAIGQMGILHLFDVAQLGGWAVGLHWSQVRGLERSYDALARRMMSLLAVLGLPSAVPMPETPRIDPEGVLTQALGELDEVEPVADQIVARQREVLEQLAKLKVMAEELELISHLAIPISDLRQLRFLYLTMGLVPRENLERLRGSLASIPHLVLPIRSFDTRVLIFAFSARADKETMERALSAAYMEKIELPAEFSGTPAEALAEINLRSGNLAAAYTETQYELAQFGDCHRQELVQLWVTVEANHAVADAWTHLGRTERTFLFSGWVPASLETTLVERVEDVSHGQAVVRFSPAPRPGQGPPSGPAIPTALRNPPLLRTFEPLVRTYGLPSYWDLDPTPIAAGLFVLMFGAMFGDLGQGAILAILGVFLARGFFLPEGRQLGSILVAAGFSSMVFGLAYGSVFGAEDLIPALLFHPIRDVIFFVEVAVAFGSLIITAGMLLNAIGALRSHDYFRLFWSEYGLWGLLLYWGLVVLILRLLLGREVSVLLAAILLGIPMLVLYLREPLGRLFQRGPNLKSLIPEGGAIYFVESAVGIFDVLIRFISNTVSFLRIAAFALSHAGLGIMVFTIAGMVASLPLASPVVIILGNVLIITLEALIVGIQTLRLEYYEFFSKFFSGQGVPYDPFRLKHTRRLN